MERNPYPNQHVVTATRPGGRPARAPWPRLANLLLGAWLFLSAFLLPRGDATQVNTWVVGLIVMMASAFGILAGRARWINTAAALWLFASGAFIPYTSTAALWNNVLVATAIFMFSLSPNRPLASRLSA